MREMMEMGNMMVIEMETENRDGSDGDDGSGDG